MGFLDAFSFGEYFDPSVSRWIGNGPNARAESERLTRGYAEDWAYRNAPTTVVRNSSVIIRPNNSDLFELEFDFETGRLYDNQVGNPQSKFNIPSKSLKEKYMELHQIRSSEENARTAEEELSKLSLILRSAKNPSEEIQTMRDAYNTYLNNLSLKNKIQEQIDKAKSLSNLTH